MTSSESAPVIHLLGLIGCGELFAFETLGRDTELAETLAAKASLGRIATTQFHQFERVSDRIQDCGADPEIIIGAYIPTLRQYHAKTTPRDLLEGLMKAYVGDGISSDFGREISAYVDTDTREFIESVLVDKGQADFVVPYVQKALSADPGQAGRLALWGRRLMGEALAQAQRVAADFPELAQLVVGGADADGAGLAEFARMLARLTERHSERMKLLGLAP